LVGAAVPVGAKEGAAKGEAEGLLEGLDDGPTEGDAEGVFMSGEEGCMEVGDDVGLADGVIGCTQQNTSDRKAYAAHIKLSSSTSPFA
jgi:hypothetical protein